MRAPKQVRRAEKLRAWGLSLAVHFVLFLLLGASGFFLLMQARPATSEEDVVDIALLAGDAGGGDGGSAPAGPSAGAAPAAPVVTLPPASRLPEIAETYTKEPQTQQAYRQQHKAEQAEAARSAATSNLAANGDATAVGTDKGRAEGAGGGQGSGFGAGVSGGDGQGTGHGNGNGNGNGSGQTGGDAQASATPVDAAAYCIYRATPAYPPAMIQAGAQGSVTVLITVSPASAVMDVSVIRSSGHAALDAAAVAAGWACRFQMNGHPGRYRTTYRFELRGSDDW
ncbi:MAG: TonB family protein [Selenomonadaceae bacterium]|nr:TonB family protein [Selenomonadaceae bacterium]